MSDPVEGLAAAASSEKRKKTRWVKIQKPMKRNGVVTTVLPFIEQEEDPRDVELVKQMIAVNPYAAGYGKIADAWETVAKNLSEATDDDGMPIFEHGITVKSLRDRVKNMTDIGQLLEEYCQRNGESITEFARSVVRMVGMYDGWLGHKKPLRRKQKEERVASIASIPTRGDQRMTTTVVAPTTTTPTPAETEDTQSLASSGDETPKKLFTKSSEPLSVEYELEKERLLRKRKQQELDEAKISLDRERFEEEKVQRKHEREQDALDREQARKAQEAQTQLLQGMFNMLQQQQKQERKDE